MLQHGRFQHLTLDKIYDFKLKDQVIKLPIHPCQTLTLHVFIIIKADSIKIGVIFSDTNVVTTPSKAFDAK